MSSLQREGAEDRHFNVKYTFGKDDIAKNIMKKHHFHFHYLLPSADASNNTTL